jgi:Spy/CpxP family protein refolding chaperone
MKTISAFLALSAAVMLPLGAPVQAEEKKPANEQPGRPSGGAARPLLNPDERLKMLTEKLSLTPEQQEKVKAVYAKNVETLKTMRQDKSLTEDARRQKFMEMRRAEMQEINAVLTPEQQEKMKTLFRERAGAARGERAPAQKAEAK